jgi:dCTP deaminase
MIVSGPELLAFVSEAHIRRSDDIKPTVDLVSVGLHLGNRFLRYKKQSGSVDLPSRLETEVVELESDGSISFPPGCCFLASTVEIVEMPLNLMGFIQTKGTIARGFVTVHLCDGQIDPGYKGQITLELVNLSNIQYRLKPGTAIAQLFLHRLSVPLTSGYEGRYQAATGPTSMRL